jgi:hypothetical protein
MKPLKSLLIGLVSFTMLGTSAFTATASDGKKNEDPFGPNRFFGAFGWNNSNLKNTGSADFAVTSSVPALSGSFTRSWDRKLDESIWNGWLGYEYNRPWATYFSVRGYYGGGSGSKDNNNFFTHNWFVEGRLGYQFTFGQEDQFSFTPYAGYGYYESKTRKSTESLSHSYTVNGVDVTISYDESRGQAKVTQQDINVGVCFNWMLMDKFSVGLTAQAMMDVSTRAEASGTIQNGKVVETLTGAVEWTQSGVKDLSRSGSGDSQVNWYFELPLMYHLDSAWDISLVPYYSWRKAKEKNTSVNVPETTVTFPNNPDVTFAATGDLKNDFKLQDFGARLELGFRF